MKECFSRSHALLGLLALTLLASLFCGAGAYEEPEEAINRRLLAELRTFREQYSRTFMYNLAKHPLPIRAGTIGGYPKGITDRANHLLQYGYHQKRPSRSRFLFCLLTKMKLTCLFIYVSFLIAAMWCYSSSH